MVRVVCGRGVSLSNVLFAQHSGGIAKRREDQQQQHNEILEKKRTRGKGQLFALCIVHYTKPIVYLKNVWKKKDEFLFFFQLLWIEIDRRERGKKKEQTILYNRNRSTAEKNTHTHTKYTHASLSLSLPFTSPPTSPDIATFWFSFWSASKWNCQHDKKRKKKTSLAAELICCFL